MGATGAIGATGAAGAGERTQGAAALLKMLALVMAVAMTQALAAEPALAGTARVQGGQARASLSERYQEFLTSDLYQLLITSKWDQQARLICGDGAGRSGMRPGQLIELEPVSGPAGKPSSGAWIHRVPGHTCGQRRTFNFLVEFGSSGPVVITLLPGETRASPLLQRDVLQKAVELLRVRVQGCETPVVVDTAQAGLLPPDATGGVAGGWAELWYFDACRRLLPLTIIFLPDGQGGTTFTVR